MQARAQAAFYLYKGSLPPPALQLRRTRKGTMVGVPVRSKPKAASSLVRVPLLQRGQAANGVREEELSGRCICLHQPLEVQAQVTELLLLRSGPNHVQRLVVQRQRVGAW